MNVFYLGIINWILTLIVVESELVRPLRDWVSDKAQLWFTVLPWSKINYAFGCHLCAGLWLGFLLAALYGGPFGGVFAIVANGLLYKAIGHATLEATSVLRRAMSQQT